MKKIYFILILILLSLDSFAQLNNKASEEKLAKERLYLRNYAFCQCLWYTYKREDSLLFIKDGSSGGYFQIGAYNINAYEIIDSIARIYSQKVYESYEGETLGIMKCLDFYNSKELNELINKLDEEIDIRKLGD